jgi:putative addiction module killer protein
MFEIRTTEKFDAWFGKLRDRGGRHRIEARIERMRSGNRGDAKPVGGNICEMRIDYGPGYRIYYTRRRSTLVILLIGGDKSSQEADIKAAQALEKHLSLE